MILILSNVGDYSTDLVVEWLRYFQADYLRLDAYDILNPGFQIVLTEKGEPTLFVKGEEIELNRVRSVWRRKFVSFNSSRMARRLEKMMDAYSIRHISGEYARIVGHIEFLLKGCYFLLDPARIPLNKLNVLCLAGRCGFKIPATYLVSSRQRLREVMEKRTLISKSVLDPLNTRLGGRNYMMYTTAVTDDDLEELPEYFFPSMVQENIQKEYEIRTFYLEGTCYSMAILSQQDPQTEQDFRKYNWNKPNRCIPYRLDDADEKRVVALMNAVGLNTGSLDFIRQKDGSLVFLEINPTGQFGMVDFPCNYGLHKRVAQILIDHDK